MRTKESSIVWCVTIAGVLMLAAASPAQDVAAAGNFQASLQQQNYMSVLTSIEERLRNLDNIYSMQLSRTLETKLHQYSRRLEALDSKIIRLEALVMLNLDKISENISTKNFKDDMTKTTLFRKMDTIYEGLSHRIGYLERKYDTNIMKIQTKVDATMTRFEKLEDNLMARDSDMEVEISDVIFAIDDVKTSCTAMEQKLYNITTAALNFTKSGQKTSQEMYVTTRKSMNVLHDNIIETLQYMNNRTSRELKIVEDNNFILKTMKSELKEDFNNYANKVADMSSYAWKNSDTIENNLMRLETVTNSTKTEVQNGVRTLMLQIGKISNKDDVLPLGDNSLDGINKNLKTNFQKILTNQDLFLESCHRVQMDESQIESEISVTLEKLISMLEKRMAVELKDIKNIERAFKTHDNRVVRNMMQINDNLISLFRKSTINTESMKKNLTKIGKDLADLFLFIKRSSKSASQPLYPLNDKVLDEKIYRLDRIISKFSLNTTLNETSYLSNFTNNLSENIIDQIEIISKNLSSIQTYLKDMLNEDRFNETMYKLLQNHFLNCNVKKKQIQTIENDQHQIEETERLIQEIFGANTKLTNSNTVENTSKIEGQKHSDENHSFLDLVDVRGNFDNGESLEYEESSEKYESTTLHSLEDIITEQFTIVED